MGNGSLKFVISHDAKLSEKEEALLVEAYRKLFIKMYNYDIVDSFLKITKMDFKELLTRKRFILKLADNYLRASKALDEVKNRDELDLFLIYDSQDNLLGGGRLFKISDNEASIPDIEIIDMPVSTMREIWMESVNFAEDYFVSSGFEKMYIEIPLADGPLLVRADDMGFYEDPNDIVISETTRTYLLNKPLERIRHVK